MQQVNALKNSCFNIFIFSFKNQLTGHSSHVANRLLIPLRNWTKSRVDFSERFDPSDYKIGLKKIFTDPLFQKNPILYQDIYNIHWLSWRGPDTLFEQKCLQSFLCESNRSHLAKRIFEIGGQGQKYQNGKVAIFCQTAILALLSLCIDFKNSFCQMTFLWVLWKTYYLLLLK